MGAGQKDMANSRLRKLRLMFYGILSLNIMLSIFLLYWLVIIAWKVKPMKTIPSLRFIGLTRNGMVFLLCLNPVLIIFNAYLSVKTKVLKRLYLCSDFTFLVACQFFFFYCGFKYEDYDLCQIVCMVTNFLSLYLAIKCVRIYKGRGLRYPISYILLAIHLVYVITYVTDVII